MGVFRRTSRNRTAGDSKREGPPPRVESGAGKPDSLKLRTATPASGSLTLQCARLIFRRWSEAVGTAILARARQRFSLGARLLGRSLGSRPLSIRQPFTRTSQGSPYSSMHSFTFATHQNKQGNPSRWLKPGFQSVVNRDSYIRFSEHSTIAHNHTAVFFVVTLLLSSFWTSRRHRCRPFSPPVPAFNAYRA